jgi:hypothetical protein
MIPYYQNNLYIPPLSQDHVERMFDEHLRSANTLPCSICKYLKTLSDIHYTSLRTFGDKMIYELTPKDLTMYYLGQQAPLSIIIFTQLNGRFETNKIIEELCLPPTCDDFIIYNSFLRNRVHEDGQVIDPKITATAVRIFDRLNERPFFAKEEYFLAGVETSRLLYNRAKVEIEKVRTLFLRA